MAKAPKPGAVKAAEEAKKTNKVFKITVRDEVSVLNPDDLGPRDDAFVRQQTQKALGYRLSLAGALQGMSSEDAMGLDILCLLWWLGRHKAGLTNESYGEALDRFPSYGEAEEALDMEEITPEEQEEDESGSPEA